jgi:uncharacterized membrane protein
MALISFYLILLVITSYAIASGWRFERYAGGLLILNALLTTTLQRVLHDFYPLVAILVNDLALLGALAWILWRYRRQWMWLIAALEVVIVLLDLMQTIADVLPPRLYADATALLAYGQLVMLGSGVLWRTYGPPAEPPEPKTAPVE